MRGRNALRIEGRTARSDVAPDLRISAIVGSALAAVRSAPVSAAAIALSLAASIFRLPRLTPLAFGSVTLGTFAYQVEKDIGPCPRPSLDRRYAGGPILGGRQHDQHWNMLLGFGGTNSQYRRGLSKSLAGFAIATVWASAAPAAPAQAARGEKLARHWCASCHIVASDQKGGSDTAPPFATIARKPGFDRGKISQFLMDPHPKMPDMQLSRDEAKDLGAYIASLAE